MKKSILLMLWLTFAFKANTQPPCFLPLAINGCPSGELACDGNFNAFNPANPCFFSTLNQSCFCAANSYCVTTQATVGVGVGKCSNVGWQNGMTGLGGAGNYMVIDGQSFSTVWQANVNVVAGRPTRFIMWVRPTVSTANAGPNLNIFLGATQVGASVTGTYSLTNDWTQYCIVFNSPVGGTVPLAIRQGNQVGDGDFGLDGISLQQSLIPPPLSLPATICNNSAPVVMHPLPLIAGINSITYSGNTSGINAATHTFNPATATPGMNVFTACYNFVGGTQCCTTYTVQVLQAPNVTSSLNLVRCETAPPITLANKGIVTNVMPYGFFTPNALTMLTSWSASPGPGLIVPPGSGLVQFDPNSSNIGTNLITYTVNGTNGCVGSATGSITVCPVPNVVLIPVNICDPTTTINSNVGIVPGGCPVTYSWSGPPGGISGPTNGPSINTNFAGTYTLTVSTAPTCSSTQSVTIQNVQPVTISTSDPTPCVGQAVTLTANSLTTFSSYIWTYNTNLLAFTTGSITVTNPGTYCVQGISGACTTAVACINVVNVNIPPITITGDTKICEGGDINLTIGLSGNCTSPTIQWFANGSPIPGATSNVLNIPSTTFPAGTIITVEVCCNGCCKIFQVAEISTGPIINFPPIPNVDLCTWNGLPILINASSVNGTNCVFSGPGIIDPVVGLFDPVAAGGAGTYTISYTCELNDCVSKVDQIITVIDNGHWHQTTKDALIRDIGNDVITDAQGNVYITGLYCRKTTFHGGGNSDVTVVSGASFQPYSFVAKYNDCGDLMWVAHAIVGGSPTHENIGNSITLDETNGLVYTAGNFLNDIRYVGGEGDFAGAPSLQGAFAPGNRGYVACFNMSDGTIHYVNPIVIDDKTYANAITINESNGKIYVGGYRNGALNPGQDFLYVQRYQPVVTPTPTTIGAFEWQIDGQGDGSSYVNDMDFDETGSANGSLWFIGDYKIELLMTGNIIVNGTTGNKDAYVALYYDNAAPAQMLFRKGNALSACEMTGKGIAVNGTTHNAYLTGDYFDISVANVYEIPGQLLPNVFTANNAYFMGLDVNGLNVWPVPNAAEALNKVVQGKSVCVKGNSVYFAGWFHGNTVFGGNAPVPSPLAYSGTTGMQHTFAVGYDATTGTALWSNHTLDPITNSIHTGNSIAADNFGHAFITGSYSGEMGYMAGIPSSGNLVASGPGTTNAFTMRVDLINNGQFKSSAAENEITITDEMEIASGLLVYPNPTNAQLNVEITSFDVNATYTLMLFNSIGKMVKQITVTGEKTMIDLSGFENGIYLLSYNNGKTTEVVRISKTN